MKDATDNSEYCLEHPEGGEWQLHRNDQKLFLAGAPQMYSDGGTVEARFTVDGEAQDQQPNPETTRTESEDEWTVSTTFVMPLTNQLNIPQQLFAQREPQPPTLNGRPLELLEWWIGGRRHLNGATL